MADLETCSIDELRAEARRRGFELHSKLYSEAAAKLLRDIPVLRARLDAMESDIKRACG